MPACAGMTKWPLWLVLFGLVVPFGLFKLNRRIGAPLLLVLAAASGLAYGAAKADNPWSGDGLMGNLRLMAISALVMLAYVALALGVAGLIAKARSSFRKF